MTTTKSGITLLAPKTMSNLIKTIESNLPGWWWSVSQKADKLRISVGPSQYCLLDIDREMATIKEKEEFLFDLVLSESLAAVSDQVPEWFLAKKTEVINPEREEISQKKEKDFPGFVGTPRQQSRDDRHIFRKSYGKFLSEVPALEKDGDVAINEIYVGSCQLSVDVSIRGVGRDAKEFDISYDYQGKAILADSFNDAVDQFKEEIVKEAV